MRIVGHNTVCSEVDKLAHLILIIDRPIVDGDIMPLCGIDEAALCENYAVFLGGELEYRYRIGKENIEPEGIQKIVFNNARY